MNRKDKCVSDVNKRLLSCSISWNNIYNATLHCNCRWENKWESDNSILGGHWYSAWKCDEVNTDCSDSKFTECNNDNNINNCTVDKYKTILIYERILCTKFELLYACNSNICK